jgi:hypothetical protein
MSLNEISSKQRPIPRVAPIIKIFTKFCTYGNRIRFESLINALKRHFQLNCSIVALYNYFEVPLEYITQRRLGSLCSSKLECCSFLFLAIFVPSPALNYVVLINKRYGHCMHMGLCIRFNVTITD